MSSKDERSQSSLEKSEEKFENIKANEAGFSDAAGPTEVEAPAQREQTLQVGTSLEKSYSADELTEPMKVFPIASVRANEGQELTVRKRLILTERDDSTIDETQEQSAIAQEEELKIDDMVASKSANFASTAEVCLSRDMSSQALLRSRDNSVNISDASPSVPESYQLKVDDGVSGVSSSRSVNFVSSGLPESPDMSGYSRSRSEKGSNASRSSTQDYQFRVDDGGSASRSDKFVTSGASEVSVGQDLSDQELLTSKEALEVKVDDASPSPAIIENKEGPSVGDVQDYSILSASVSTP